MVDRQKASFHFGRHVSLVSQMGASFFTDPLAMARVRHWIILVVMISLGLAAASGPPKVSGKIHHRHIAKSGRNTKLVCPVEADPLPLTQWKKDGRTIHSGWTRFKVSQDGQLRIRDVEMDDAGQYLCKATNGFGSININYTLIVLNEKKGLFKEDDSLFKQSPEENLRKEGAPPKFKDILKMKRQSIVRPVGSSVRFKCRAVGNPRPHVTWFKDDYITQEEKDTSPPLWILKLHNIQETDTGRYTCVVTNRLGSINYTYTLEVVEKIKNKPELVPPHPMNTTVQYGETASFQCRVMSVVQPHIQWLKRVEDPETTHNMNTTIVVKGQQFVVLKTGEVWNRPDGSYLNKLIIQRATEQDAGMYICLGANSMGYNFRSAFLTVLPGKGKGVPYSSEGATSNSTNNLPLFIGVPSFVVLILVILFIFLLQRRRRCNTTSGGLKVQRHAVPTHERDFYTNYHNTNMLQVSREKIPKTQSLDYYSDNISSVSRNHQHSHQQSPYSY